MSEELATNSIVPERTSDMETDFCNDVYTPLCLDHQSDSPGSVQ